ncbi:MAG: radical SAM protein, partial [Synergistaceae bacterium]|nr:radical SAM protein [Synergistaceae bacterium]
MKRETPSLVNMNVNPCKMCMPMGAASAFYGIRGCMSILHGSQGCATYIRRHMATHYNEPVDIASSSLTEEGTVFGGEKNLLKGLENLIKLYNPEVIGIATTCLAETIGEDVLAFVRKFYALHPEYEDIKIVTVASSGYGGTQCEGFFKTLRALVEQADCDPSPNGRINITTPMISPADSRWLKGFLEEMGIPYFLLPDLSENLDGASEERYVRLKSGGTPIADVGKMAGAKLTVEFSEFISESDSPARYLADNYGVPFVRLPLPMGIRAMDSLIDLLCKNGGLMTNRLRAERGRYLDAMVDSHKYCAMGRAAIFGEPDFVSAAARLCCENGVVPVLAATGSVCPAFREKLAPDLAEASERAFESPAEILDDCDFSEIEDLCGKRDVNIMIGNSDGRRISHALGIDLVRRAFPIHDRVGGQRARSLGFDGSLDMLDAVANCLLRRQEGFRSGIFGKFFPESVKKSADLAGRTASHPCFSEGACANARLHLPVARECNIQCNYCVRKYDCPNESRPGVSSAILSPEEAFELYLLAKSRSPRLAVVGIAGPGDSLADFQNTKKTLAMIRGRDKDTTFCISTNGLLLPKYANELTDVGVTHVTVTVNAVDPEIGARIYKHVDYMGMRLAGVSGAAALLASQIAGVMAIRKLGCAVKVNCVAIPGVNDGHIPAIAERMKELGVDIINIMPHIAVKGAEFGELGALEDGELEALRARCEKDVKQMRHCRHCRADAFGRLGEDIPLP